MYFESKSLILLHINRMFKRIIIMKHQKIFFLLFLLSVVAGSSCTKRASQDQQEDSISQAIEPQQAEEEPRPAIPLQHQALLSAYPGMIEEINDNFVVLANGEKIIYDDGKEKNFEERLDDSDIEDMFYDVYTLPDPEPPYQFDPGRSRSEALYKAMYGKSAEAVRKNLTNVEWFGQKVSFTSVNGGADSLKAVAKEIAEYPELKPYLKSSGTFYWRPVRGAKRMSAHSYGIAFDIGVDKSDYWQWKGKTNDENKKVPYANKIPRKLVEIFQKHGFIWGGAWYHYDTMHFEFRPELLEYARLTEEQSAR